MEHPQESIPFCLMALIEGKKDVGNLFAILLSGATISDGGMRLRSGNAYVIAPLLVFIGNPTLYS